MLNTQYKNSDATAHTDCALLDLTSVGIVVLDCDQTIVIWNTWMEQHSGIDSNFALGRTLLSVFNGALNQRINHAIEQALHQKQSAVLSHQIHNELLPLKQAGSQQILAISMAIKPVSSALLPQACLIEIQNINTLEKYERLIAKQTNEIRALSTQSLYDQALGDALFDTASDVILIIDQHGRIVRCNARAEARFGYKRSELTSKLIHDLLEKPEQQALDLQHDLIHSTRDTPMIGITHLGKRFPASVTFTSLNVSAPSQYLVILHDETRVKEIESQLTAVKTRSELALNSINDAIVVTNGQGMISFMNRAAEQLTAWNRRYAIGQAAHIILSLTDASQGEPILIYDFEPNKSQNTQDSVYQNATLKRKDRVCIEVEFSVTRLATPNQQRSGLVIVLHDLTERQNAKQKIAWQRSHDSLTGLVNRVEFEMHLSRLLQDESENLHDHALLYLDIDQFKIVNDLCGHLAGDELLRQLTAIISQHVPAQSAFARLGGDEFGILLCQHRPDQAQAVAQSIHQQLREFRFKWFDHVFSVTVSIGLIPINAYRNNTSALLSIADAACFFAKESGRNRTYIAKDDDQELLQRREEMQWVSRIHYALEHNNILLFGQLIVPLDQNAGMRPRIEILARMIDADQIISPAKFVNAAERYDLMPTLDREIINKTLSVLSQLNNTEELCININLSAKSINNDSFLPYLEKTLRASPITPSSICFEITETAALHNLEHATHFILKIQALGCEFALDDFGSGLSSLAYLKNLPVNYLKIDGTFVQNVMVNTLDFQMLQVINQLGKVMRVKTIAEYVENEAMISKLKEIGIDYAQGFALSTPEPLSNLISKYNLLLK